MEAKLIDLSEWQEFGEGGIGVSYSHKYDDSVILKLNNESWPMQKAVDEFRHSKAVFDMGIPCPDVYEVVTDGKRYGFTCQRIKGKKSLSRLVSENPEKMEEYAAEFAALARELHSTPCNTDAVNDTLAIQKEYIDRCTLFSADVRAKLESIYADFDRGAKTCLHGDLHIGNLIVAGDRKYWIDLGNFSFGDPLMDISNMYLIGYYLPTKMTEDLFHMSMRTYRRFFKIFLRHYYGTTPDAALMEKIRRAAIFRAGLCVAARPASAPLFLPIIKEQRLKFAIVSFLANFAKPKI